MAASTREFRSAALYDRFVDPLLTAIRDRAIAFVSPEEGWRVLDVGCGTGATLERYLDAGCDVVGVDVSEAMVEMAAERTGGRAELHHTDGGRLPFDDDVFDLVTTSLVIHGIPEDERLAFLREMIRVTRADGRVLITDFRFGSLRGWVGRLSRIVSTTLEAVSGHYSHFRSYKRRGGIPGLLEEAGSEPADVKVVSGGNFGLYLVRL